MGINTTNTAASSISKAITTQAPTNSSQAKTGSSLSASGVSESQASPDEDEPVSALSPENSSNSSGATASKTVSRGYSTSPTSQASAPSAPITSAQPQPMMPMNNAGAMTGFAQLGQAGKAMLDGLKALSEQNWGGQGARPPGGGPGGGSQGPNNKPEANKPQALDPKKPEDKAKTDTLSSAYAHRELDSRKATLLIYTNDTDKSKGLRDLMTGESKEDKAKLAELNKHYNVVHLHQSKDTEGKTKTLVVNGLEYKDGKPVFKGSALDPKSPDASLVDNKKFSEPSAVIFAQQPDGKSFKELAINLGSKEKDKSLSAGESADKLISAKNDNLHYTPVSSLQALANHAGDQGFMQHLQKVNPDMAKNLQALSLPALPDPKNPGTPQNGSYVSSFDPKNASLYDKYKETPVKDIINPGTGLGLGFTDISKKPNEKVGESSGPTLEEFGADVFEEYKKYLQAS